MGKRLFKSKTDIIRERADDVQRRLWGLLGDCTRVLLLSPRPGARLARYLLGGCALFLVLYFFGGRITRWIEYLFALMGGFSDVPPRGGA